MAILIYRYIDIRIHIYLSKYAAVTKKSSGHSAVSVLVLVFQGQTCNICGSLH